MVYKYFKIYFETYSEWRCDWLLGANWTKIFIHTSTQNLGPEVFQVFASGIRSLRDPSPKVVCSDTNTPFLDSL